jgi:phage terminase large subunit-like protein
MAATDVQHLRQQLRKLSATQRATILTSLSDDTIRMLAYDWGLTARDSQLEPTGDYETWVLKPGRGFGKTLTGAQTVRQWIESGQRRRIALVNDTADDVNGVMIYGPVGLMSVCPPWNKPRHIAKDRQLVWDNSNYPSYGAVCIAYAAEAPGRIRGPQHDGAWCDELTKWKNLQKKDERGDTALSNLRMGLRMLGPKGASPRLVVTTTPRPIRIFKALIAEPTTVVTHGTTFENAANLAPTYLAMLKRQYEHTRLGRQELRGDMLEAAEGALWSPDMIDAARVEKAPELRRVVVAIDPAVTSNEDSDETGIVVAGVGEDGDGYVLDDLSGTYSPKGWADVAIKAYNRRSADRIIAEVNNGGEMVEFTIRTVDSSVSYKSVHASRGKRTRAEPVSALYEQGRVHHVGMLADLENQMCNWSASTGERSPDRMDALVWALSELMLEPEVMFW